MNYLSYQPAFDVFHTEFRLLRLRRLMGADTRWHIHQLRIADFYLLFFGRLASARLAPKHRAIKKLALQASARRYERQPDDNLLFGRMAAIQITALRTLAAKEFFDKGALSHGLVIETDLAEPDALARRVDAANDTDAARLQALQALIEGYELLGPDGLKARTGLLEHKYDAI